MFFQLKNKSGFISFDKTIEIFDNNGIPFYIKKNKKRQIHFNLPRGSYQTRNVLASSDFRKYKTPEIPKPNLITKLPDKLLVLFISNPHKCSINLKDGVIYFDFEFKKYPKPLIDFVKFHELGHYFFKGEGNESEKNCDLFSGSIMLALGYNPSQIIWAQRATLSEKGKAVIRKKFVEQFIKKSF